MRNVFLEDTIVNEAVEMAKMIDGKVDIIHVSAGIHENDDVFVITTPVHVHRTRLQRTPGS